MIGNSYSKRTLPNRQKVFDWQLKSLAGRKVESSKPLKVGLGTFKVGVVQVQAFVRINRKELFAHLQTRIRYVAKTRPADFQLWNLFYFTEGVFPGDENIQDESDSPGIQFLPMVLACQVILRRIVQGSSTELGEFIFLKNSKKNTDLKEERLFELADNQTLFLWHHKICAVIISQNCCSAT